MMNKEIILLFNNLAEGIVIVSANGKIKFSNKTAREILSSDGDPFLSHPVLIKKLSAAKEAFLYLPHTFDLASGRQGSSDQHVVTLLNSPVEGDYIFLLRNTANEMFYRNVIDNFSEIYQHELLEQFNTLTADLQAFIDDAKTLPDNIDGLPGRYAAIKQSGDELMGNLVKLANFASLTAQQKIVTDERIDTSQLIDDALTKVTHLASKKHIRFVVTGRQEELPAIYGSKFWLEQSLREILVNAIEHAQPKTNIRIHLHNSSFHLLIFIRNFGSVIPPQFSDLIFKPYYRIPPAYSQTAEHKRLGLGLSLCEKVLSLHGGKISLSNTVDDGAEFVLEIPLGTNNQSYDEFDIQQSHLYAMDLAKLLQETRQDKPISHKGEAR